MIRLLYKVSASLHCMPTDTCYCASQSWTAWRKEKTRSRTGFFVFLQNLQAHETFLSLKKMKLSFGKKVTNLLFQTMLQEPKKKEQWFLSFGILTNQTNPLEHSFNSSTTCDAEVGATYAPRGPPRHLGCQGGRQQLWRLVVRSSKGHDHPRSLFLELVCPWIIFEEKSQIVTKKGDIYCARSDLLHGGEIRDTFFHGSTAYTFPCYTVHCRDTFFLVTHTNTAIARCPA
jgi:hypothetical protein